MGSDPIVQQVTSIQSMMYLRTLSGSKQNKKWLPNVYFGYLKKPNESLLKFLKDAFDIM